MFHIFIGITIRTTKPFDLKEVPVASSREAAVEKFYQIVSPDDKGILSREYKILKKPVTWTIQNDLLRFDWEPTDRTQRRCEIINVFIRELDRKIRAGLIIKNSDLFFEQSGYFMCPAEENQDVIVPAKNLPIYSSIQAILVHFHRQLLSYFKRELSIEEIQIVKSALPVEFDLTTVCFYLPPIVISDEVETQVVYLYYKEKNVFACCIPTTFSI